MPADEPALFLLGLLEEPARSAVVGIDEGAPRPLELWQVDDEGGRAARVGVTRSTSDGAFLVDRMVLPERSLRLGAPPAGGDPHHAPPEQWILRAAPAPPPPRAELTESREGAALHAVSEAAAYTLLLGDDEGSVRARIEVPPRRGPVAAAATRSWPLEVGDELPTRVARELPDGRRSSWIPLGTRTRTFPASEGMEISQ